jgi:lysophospholipase L1-like esterase
MTSKAEDATAKPLGAPTPFMFNVDVGPEHLTSFHKACATGKATVVCFGDSIVSQQADLISPTESPWFTFVQQLRAHNPGVAMTEHNYAIAGQVYAQMESSLPLSHRPEWWYKDAARTWFSYVAAAQPDLVFLYSGGNDGYGFNVATFKSLIAQLNALRKPPSLIFGIVYPPSRSSTVNNYHLKRTQDGIAFTAGWVRGYAKRHGYGFLDFMRWHNRCRDGYDSTETSCTLVNPAPDTPLNWYPSAPIAASPAGAVAFPANINENGVPANLVTDFYVNFTLHRGFKTPLSINLSNAPRDPARPAPNAFNLVPAGGRFRYYWSDAADDFIDDTTTDLPVPDGPVTLSIAVKNELLTCALIPAEFLRMGFPLCEFGKIDICALSVIRFGAPFAPVISGIPPGETLSFNNICVADHTLATPNSARFTPVLTDADIYTKLPNAGGSGAYHMNAYGVQKIMNPVIKAANFRPGVRAGSPPVITGSRGAMTPEILAALLRALHAQNIIRDDTTP